MLKTIISLLILGLMAGCSTPQSRARGHAELMETLSSEERAMIEAGEVDLGFTEEMVEVALGKPDRTYVERTAEGERLIWAYHGGSGLSGLSVGVGTGIGIGSRGSSFGGGVLVGTGGRLRDEEKMRVVFEGGSVVGIEQADR